MVALYLSSVFALGAQSADDVLNRYEAVYKKLSRFSLVAMAGRDNEPPVKLRIVIDKKLPGVRVDATRGKYRFHSAQLGKFIRQLNFLGRQYDDLESERIALAGFRMDGVMDGYFPRLITFPSIRSGVSQNGKFKVIGSEKIGGVSTDHIQTKNRTDVGLMVSDFWIDQEGYPRKYTEKYEGSPGGYAVTLSDWKILSSIPSTEFQLRIPDGFTPYALPKEPPPLEAGSQFPMAGWKIAESSKDVDLKSLLGPSGGLVMVLGTDSISNACRATLQGLVSKGVKFVVVEAEGGSKIPGALSNKNPKVIRELTPGDLPLGFFVDGKGINVGMVQGFDRSKPKDFLDQVMKLVNQKN